MAAKDARDAKEKKKADTSASNKKQQNKAEEKKAVSMQELFDEGDQHIFAVKRPTPQHDEPSDTESENEDTPSKRANKEDEVQDENVDNFLSS